MPEIGIPYHVGAIVHDLDKSMSRYHSLLGLGPWATRVSDVETVYRGRTLRHVSRLAFARWGGAYFELNEPVSGESPAHDFLRERGEGINHVGYFVEAEQLENADAPLLTVKIDGEVVAVYLDTFQALGMCVELVRGTREPAFHAWAAAASYMPDEQ